MTWLIRWGDIETTSDDFLIEDLERIEKATGVPWSVANPMREIKVARAFLAAAMIRAGRSDDQVVAALGSLTLGTMKGIFDYVPDDAEVSPGDPLPLKRKRGQITRASSHGAPGKAGRQASSGSSA